MTIRDSLGAVKAATFSIILQDPNGPPTAAYTGTGFFVSADGWFITAAHVVMQDGALSPHLANLFAVQHPDPSKPGGSLPAGYHRKLEYRGIDLALDLAYFKVDYEAVKDFWFLQGKDGIPHIPITTAPVEEGEPVYAFGYPMTEMRDLLPHNPGAIVGPTLSPRVTSAICASKNYFSQPITSSADPACYVIDKALNFGNSGGPIIRAETGEVFAICSAFQPIAIPQRHWPMRDAAGNFVSVIVPSLYGIVASLANRAAVDFYRANGIPFNGPE